MFEKYLMGSILLHIFFLIGAGFCLPKTSAPEVKPVFFEIANITPVAALPDAGRGERALITNQYHYFKSKVKQAVPAAPAESISNTIITPDQSIRKKEEDKLKAEVVPQHTPNITQRNPNEVVSNSEANTKKEGPIKEVLIVDPDADSGTSVSINQKSTAISDKLIVPNDGSNGSGNIEKNHIEPGNNEVVQTVKSQEIQNVTGGISPKSLVSRPPLIIHNPSPSYPQKAKDNNWEGIVILQVFIRTDGSVGEVTIYKSSNYKILDQEAIKTVRTWRFQPALKDGIPIETTFKIKFPFKLED